MYLCGKKTCQTLRLMKKFKYFLLVFLIFAVLGYFREFFFVQINNILYRKYYNRETMLAVAPLMQIFQKFSYDGLYYAKYLLTLIWLSFFLWANYFALKKLSDSPILIKILLYTYAIMLLLAVGSMTFGYFFNDRLQDDEYTLSRWLMGIAQSPIICLILLASEKLYKNSPYEKR